MKKAEDRAMNEGKVLRDGAVPLIGKELTDMEAYPGLKQRIFLNFLLPVIMIIVIALAYSVNQLSKDMGTANYIVDIAKGFLTPQLLPAVIFLIAAIMAFSTGSSWGTFAICMPIALPLAFSFSGGAVTTLVAAAFAAVAGGGVFGDHCSPLSDTTVLASTGAAADHIDHVRTQLPYAIICAAISLVGYLMLGFMAI